MIVVHESGFFEGWFFFACCCPLVLIFGMAIPSMIGLWKVFEKAGEPGWAALVPIYNVMTLAQIAGKEPTDGLLACIPCVGIYFLILILIDVTKRFGVGGGHVAGLLLLPFIFWPMLGFGDARPRRLKRRRPRRVEEDEDEDDRPRRRYREEEEDEDRYPRRSRRRDEDEDDRFRRRRRDDDDD